MLTRDDHFPLKICAYASGRGLSMQEFGLSPLARGIASIESVAGNIAELGSLNSTATRILTTIWSEKLTLQYLS